jgi:hypothetical protein
VHHPGGVVASVPSLLPVAAGSDELPELDDKEAIDLVGVRLECREAPRHGDEGKDGNLAPGSEHHRQFSEHVDGPGGEGHFFFGLAQGRGER